MDTLSGIMADGGVIFVWAIALTIGVPIVVIVLGEVIERLRKTDSPYESPFQNLRNIFLPALVLMLIATQVLNWGQVNPVDPESVLGEPWQVTTTRVIQTVFWFAFAYTALSFVSALTVRARMRRPDGELSWEGRLPTITRTIARVIAIILPFAMLASTVWNLDLSKFLTAIGVGSIAIAFALQNTLSSVISGILLALDKPFKEGDWLEVDGDVGEVVDLNWRTTRLLVDGRDIVVIPNIKLLDSTLKNYTTFDIGYRDKISFGFAYRNMPNLVKDVAMQVARECPWTSNTRDAEVHLSEYGDSSVNYIMHFHVDEYSSAFQAQRIREDLMTRLFYAAARHDLEIPFPIRTLRETHTGDLTDEERTEMGMAALRSNVALAGAKLKTLSTLAAAAELREFGRGTFVSLAGVHEGGLSIIQDGRLVIRTVEGQDLRTLGQGQMVGARYVVGKRTNQHNTVAVDDCTVLHFPASAIDRALLDDAGLARGLHGYSDALLAQLDEATARFRQDKP